MAASRPVFSGAKRPMILDGGLATALEDEGYVLDDPLWSAALIQTHPDVIRRVHARYLDAGADVITSATYQATFPGLASPWGRRRGRTGAAAAQVFDDAVTLADEARRAHAERTGRWAFVAASIGSYGAFLADGAEYRGRYGVSRAALRDLHAPRLDRFASDLRVDALACETVPSGEEAVLLAELLAERGRPGWVSIVVGDPRSPRARARGGDATDAGHGEPARQPPGMDSVQGGGESPDPPFTTAARLADGTPLRDVARAILETSGRSAAARLGVGLNCVHPRRVTEALPALQGLGLSELAAYANAGETFAAGHWCGARVTPTAFAVHAAAWIAAGATLVGGCCRTTPGHIAALAELVARRT